MIVLSVLRVSHYYLVKRIYICIIYLFIFCPPGKMDNNNSNNTIRCNFYSGSVWGAITAVEGPARPTLYVRFNKTIVYEFVALIVFYVRNN